MPNEFTTSLFVPFRRREIQLPRPEPRMALAHSGSSADAASAHSTGILQIQQVTLPSFILAGAPVKTKTRTFTA
jgi:hypothetical protein